jgi:hypothetical protein
MNETMVFGQTPTVSPITSDEFAQAVQNRVTPLGEYFNAVTYGSFQHSIPGAVYENSLVPDDDRTPSRAPGAGRSGVAVYDRTGVPVMSDDEYKTSEFYRKGIPYDARMTEARAKAKAEIFDEDQYRAWARNNRPWGVGTVAAAVAGSVVGAAPDPTNYIPIFGQAFRAANATRIGVMMARAGVGAIENAAITAVVDPVIASSRRQFGEDMGFADQLMDVALAGLFGAGVGAIHGRFGHIPERIEDRNPATVSGALHTLGSAADAVANERPVDIAGPFRRTLLEGTSVSRGIARTDLDIRGLPVTEAVAQAPAVQAERLTQIDTAITSMETAGQQVRKDVKLVDLYRERTATADRVLASMPEDEWSAAVQRALYEPSTDRKVQTARTEIAAVEAKIDNLNVTQRQAANGERLSDLVRERDQLVAAAAKMLPAAKREQIARAYLEQATPEHSPSIAEPASLPGEDAVRAPDFLDEIGAEIRQREAARRGPAPRSNDSVAQEAPLTSPERVAQADAAVGKPEKMTGPGFKDRAAEHGLDEAGNFEEMAELKAIGDEALTADERNAIKDADATVTKADDYAKAYQAAASCLMKAAE